MADGVSKWRSGGRLRIPDLKTMPRAAVDTGLAPVWPDSTDRSALTAASSADGAVLFAREQLKMAIGETSDLHAAQRRLVERVLSLERLLAGCMENLSVAAPGPDAEDSANRVPVLPSGAAKPSPPRLPCNGGPPSTTEPAPMLSGGGGAPDQIPLEVQPPGNCVRPSDTDSPKVKSAKTKQHLQHLDEAKKAGDATPLDTIFHILPENACSQRLREMLDWMLANTIEPKRQGLLAATISSKRFELLTVVVMVFNAGFAAYVSDDEMYHISMRQANPEHSNNEATLLAFQRVEIALLSFYILELFAKWIVHGRYLFCNEDWRWNVFDLVLVIFSAMDMITSTLMEGGEGTNVSFMRVLRLLRLSKLLRLFRAFRLFTELRLMLNALAHSFTMVFWALFMLLIILFVISLVICQGVSVRLNSVGDSLPAPEIEEAILHFGSVYQAMLALYMCMTGGSDWGGYFRIMESVGPLYAIGFLCYTAFFVFSLFNILTGMVVENVVKAAGRDDEVRSFNFRMKKREDCMDLARLFNQLDGDNSGKINAEELLQGLDSEPVQVIMDKVELDPKDTELFFNMLSSLSDDREVDVNAFVDGCMCLRGPAAGIDLQALMFETRIMAKNMKYVRQIVSELRDAGFKPGPQVAAAALETEPTTPLLAPFCPEERIR